MSETITISGCGCCSSGSSGSITGCCPNMPTTLHVTLGPTTGTCGNFNGLSFSILWNGTLWMSSFAVPAFGDFTFVFAGTGSGCTMNFTGGALDTLCSGVGELSYAPTSCDPILVSGSLTIAGMCCVGAVTATVTI